MSLCCIGGVCIPYSALVPFLVYGLQWVVSKLASLGLLPDAVHDRLQRFLTLPPKEKKEKPCCATAANSSISDDNGTSAITTIDADDQWNSILESKEFVACKFTASWCQPCKKIQPVYESLATASPSASFCILDVDDVDEVASEYKVAILPTFIVFKNGKEVARYAGSKEQKLRDLMAENL